MEFPLWHFPLIGDGMAIGVVAVVHVIISHGVAIGSVFMLAVAERLAHKRGIPGSEYVTRRIMRALVVVVTGAGAISGVGIWFTITALAPSGAGTLVRLYFWPWFFEWLVFMAEVAGLLFLFYKWDSWSGTRRAYRARFMFLYAFFGTLSTPLITGILASMLTPGGWYRGGGALSGFFNPGFLPQTALRLGLAYGMGAAFIAAALLLSGGGIGEGVTQASARVPPPDS